MQITPFIKLCAKSRKFYCLVLRQNTLEKSILQSPYWKLHWTSIAYFHIWLENLCKLGTYVGSTILEPSDQHFPELRCLAFWELEFLERRNKTTCTNAKHSVRNTDFCLDAILEFRKSALTYCKNM